MTEHAMAMDRRIRGQVWFSIAAVLVLWGLARTLFGPLPQNPAYHLFADMRTCLGIPRAGDVLTNLAILAAAVFGLALRPNMTLAPDERAAANLMIAGAALTALGSAYYHLDPNNMTLVWDRLPMTLVMMPALTLILADRIHPLHARYALWPYTLTGAASVLVWAWSEAAGAGDLWLYGIVRVGSAAVILPLVAFCKPRHTATYWIVAALVFQAAMFAFEHFDHEIFQVTGGVASGHNLKHVAVGITLACVFLWLRTRQLKALPTH